jgi:hypothetical protein
MSMRLSMPGIVRGLAATALIALQLFSFRALQAQSSGIQPVASDTIYKLAVDSAAYKQYAFVYLLDDGIVRVENNGHDVERYHQIVQILKPAGVKQWAERQFGYRPGHNKVTVNWMRVVRPSGELISDKPNISQESTVPAQMMDPVYSDAKVMRYSLSGVAVGTIVDISYTTETIDPFLSGDFLHSWNTSMPFPALRSRYVLDAPVSMTPRIIEKHLDFKRVESQSGARKYYVWAKTQSMPVRGEMFAPDSAVPFTTITVGSPLHWSDVSKWYTGLAKDRYGLSPSSIAKIDSIARLQRTAADTLAALHRWIARDIRYVSVALGLGGYQPRRPDSTIAVGFGDCKDKATLFIAAAKHLGVTAYPVLLNSRGVADPTLVSITQFDHLIAAVPKRGATGYTFLDLTTDVMLPGEVVPSYQGEFGLVVRPDGSGDEVRFPKDSSDVTSMTFEGEVDALGKIAGRVTVVPKGGAATTMRMGFVEPLDSAAKSRTETLMGSLFGSGIVDSLITFDGRDPKAEPRMSFRVRDGEGFKRVGSVAILPVPLMLRGASVYYVRRVSQLAADSLRKLPIDAEKVHGNGTEVDELRVTLPEGWKAQLPRDVTALSDFGEYRSTYVQNGRVLRITHSIIGKNGVFPKERIADLHAWLKLVVGDNVESIAVMAPPVP